MADVNASTGPSKDAGPVVQSVQDQGQKTGAELSNFAAARKTPPMPAAIDQPLTQYHSFFCELLSWNNPRASAIAYATIVSTIVAIRYLDVLRWTFKLTWMALGITVAAEVAGKTLLNTGFSSQLRPRNYYMVPRESLDALIGDVHELINFFVVEAQRVLPENVCASAAIAAAAFLSYFLVKIVPYWGLALVATTATFFLPLIYTSNQELIDAQLRQASDIVNAQTEQLREAAQKHSAAATELTKQYVGDYTAKAQQMLRGRGDSDGPPKVGKVNNLDAADFPAAPKTDFVHSDDLVDTSLPANTDGAAEADAPKPEDPLLA